MDNAWEKFKRDVNAVTDDQIEEATKESQYIIDREWVEAVTAEEGRKVSQGVEGTILCPEPYRM